MSNLNRVAILTSRAPPPRPSNSQAIISNGLIFCSGALGVDPVTKLAVQGSVGNRAVSPYLMTSILLSGSS
jgi:2-iminobutanoate/2-iminopropanoate deaminase